jgi:hypothetical protein
LPLRTESDMNLPNFIQELATFPAEVLASQYLKREVIAAFETSSDYASFRQLVQSEVKYSEFIAVVGTGNWGYSLNPEKAFKPFDHLSDIDVAVISLDLFQATWNELRHIHRSLWHGLAYSAQQALRRNGENVYCGFVNPMWIPDKRSACRYEFKSMTNRLSNGSPGRREVRMMYFKNETEAIDYYKRGFYAAQGKVKRHEV